MGCRVGKDALEILKNLLHFQGKEKVLSFVKPAPSHNTNYVFPVPIRNSHKILYFVMSKENKAEFIVYDT
jgi:hypothetical protein